MGHAYIDEPFQAFHLYTFPYGHMLSLVSRNLVLSQPKDRQRRENKYVGQ